MLTNQITNLNVSIDKLVKNFKDFDDKQENAVLNMATIVAHMHGITIPSYKCEKKVKGNVVTYEVKEVKGYENELSYSKVAEMVGKSKSLCVLYGNVITEIIKEGLFEEIANGSIPFNMNKLRDIIANKDKLIDDKHTFKDLMHYSEENVKKMIAEKEGTTSNTSNSSTTSNNDDSKKPIAFIYEGVTYDVELSIKTIEKILEKATARKGKKK